MVGWGVAVAVVGPLLAVVLHELTHLAAARLWAPVATDVTSLVPFRIRLTFTTPPPGWYQRVIVLAPILVGVGAAIVVRESGIWSAIARFEPHYLDTFLMLSWVIYLLPSRADMAAFLRPRATGPEPTE